MINQLRAHRPMEVQHIYKNNLMNIFANEFFNFIGTKIKKIRHNSRNTIKGKSNTQHEKN